MREEIVVVRENQLGDVDGLNMFSADVNTKQWFSLYAVCQCVCIYVCMHR